MKQTRTELHTHLMGMLSAKEFLKLLEDYTSKIYYPVNDSQNEFCEEIPVCDLINMPGVIEAISIPDGTRRPYGEGLHDIYRNRSELLAYVIQKKAKRCHVDEKVIREIVYNDYFNRCLKELVQHGVEYTEISFANEDLIEHFKQKRETKGKIKYTFLLCTQRTNKIGASVQYKMKHAYEEGNAIGFDIMGMETPLDDDELKETGRKSYYKKLNTILETLVTCPNSVLRIHSGEAPGTEGNSEKIFRIIDKIKGEKGYNDFPPPEFRIGHGIHYIKSDYYYDFLKQKHAIIEINAMSNFALSNIHDIYSLPYFDYVKHGIPIAISTDGHGAYNTSIIIEDKIAYINFLKENIPAAYNAIVEWEQDYIIKKVSK